MDDNQGQQPVLPNPDNVPRQQQNEGPAQGGPPEYRAQYFPVEPNNPPPGFQPAQFPPRNNQGAQPLPQQPYVVHQYPQHRHMPSRYDRNALKFDGKPTSLRRFFDEIEALARDCGINQREQITHTIRYLDGDDYDAWSSRPSARGDDWARFKQEITTLYPGAEDNARFNVTDLELFVERHAANPMKDRFQFGEYYRNFLTRAGWLLDRDIISHRERNKLFMNGFHINFRHQLRTQLRLQDPIHPLDEPWDITEVEQAARFLLEGSSMSSILTMAAPSPINQLSPYPSRQTFDMTSIEQMLISDTFLNRLAERINGPSRNGPYGSQQNSQQQQRRTVWPCGFCSDSDHMFKNCQKLDEYIRRGLCIRDSTNRICVPDGTQVSPQIAPGRNMMERIDGWHKARPMQGVRAQSNILGVVAMNENVPSESVAESTSRRYEIRTNTDDEEELVRLEAIALANLKRREEIRKRITSADKDKNSPPNPKQPPKVSNTTPSAPAILPTSKNPSNGITTTNPPSHQQQYRFASPIEDPKAVEQVIQRSLDGTVTLTQRELYAIAPEVRKHIKEQVSTHRVPAGQLAAASSLEETCMEEESPSFAVLHHHLSTPSNPIIVANHIEDLRTIPLELDGKFTVDAILDEGSQIIGIRRDVWERLGVPLLKNQGILMESANATTEMTLGLICDLPVRIGTSIFYLQVQVFENAPYEMLLGRPFLTLTQAQTHHYRNGDSHITLLDPNTKETITIPTMVRIRGPTQSNTGF